MAKKACPQPHKAAYGSEKQANAALTKIARSGHTWDRPDRAYECTPGCGKWHLTSAPKG